MRKAYSVISAVILCSLLSGCACSQPENTLKSQNKIFSPLIKGLEWGMTEDEVKEALGCEDCEILHVGEDISTMYSISAAQKTSVFGMEMECGVFLEEVGNELILSRIRFNIEEKDIEALKEKLVKRYKGYEGPPKNPLIEDEPLVWYSLAVNELTNYEEVIEVICEEYGEGVYYETWSEAFFERPLVWCILYEDNHEFWKNTLWVYGGTSSMIEYLLNN